MRPFSLVVGGLMLGSASASAALWSQDEDEVVIYVAADCDMATVVAAARSDGFSFECNAGGSAVSVAFESREDLVAGGAECAKAGDRVACTLSKYHGGHLWDRLALDEAGGAWTYAGKQTESSAYATRFDAPYADVDAVKSYTRAELAAAVDAYDAVFADIRFPWCQLCDYYAPAVGDAADRVVGALRAAGTPDLEVRFAVLDGVDAHRGLAREVGATCEWSCPLVLLKKGVAPRLVERPKVGVGIENPGTEGRRRSYPPTPPSRPNRYSLSAVS